MNLNYLISGPEAAPPLVLSHALSTDLHMWDPVMPLLEHDFRVIRYDARGHGASPTTGSDCTLAGFQRDVIDLLDRLEIPRAHFAGLSLGGMVGMGLGLDHSDRVLGLVVCDAPAEIPAAARATWEDRIAQVRSGGIEALVEPTLARWFTEAFRSNPENMDWMREMVRRTSVEGYACCATALQALDYKTRLAEMRVPVLFLTGEQDAGASPEVMGEMHDRTPGSRFVTVTGAGHLSAVEQPEEVGPAIAGFLKGVAEDAG